MGAVENGRCIECGEPLTAGMDECPACGAHIEELTQRPRFTFAILLTLLVIGFTITGFVVRGFEARRNQLAQRWYGRGDRDLQSGAASQAVDEFQTALAYSRENDTYRLKLALALMRAGKWEEARAHLLNLWEHRPGDGEVNLLLARVFANRDLAANAIRYYHGAIYGVWDANPVGNRQESRFELAEFLLSKQDQEAAQSELIALAGEPLNGTEEQIRLADLMLKANEPQRALDLYQQIRRKDRKNYAAALGAANAEYRLQRYSGALSLAREAMNLRPGAPETAELIAVSEALVDADPRTRGIGTKERADRAFRAFKIASARLESCSGVRQGDAHLQQLATDQLDDFPRLKASALRDQDAREQVMRWVFDVEMTTAKSCGNPTSEDAVLLGLARAQERER